MRTITRRRSCAQNTTSSSSIISAAARYAADADAERKNQIKHLVEAINSEE
jgi:hypothetical protein